MTLVRIIKNWQTPDLLRQTPACSGVWDGVEFTLDAVTRCDYVVVLNRVAETTMVQCPPQNVWGVIQEPPIAEYERYVRGLVDANRIFTQDAGLSGARFVHSHGALPWHVGKSYDELINAPIPEKNGRLSWITSNKANFSGHRQRLDFLSRLRNQVDFDLWGNGFTPIADKWDGLAPYQYSLAIENYSGPDYWTEKVADCFLSWTMPLYFGCTNLKDCFPEESFIQIDIRDPNVCEKINDTIHSDRWQQSRDAIAYARELVLNKHQIFPFISDRIHQEQGDEAVAPLGNPPLLTLKAISKKDTLSRPQKLRYYLRRLRSKLLRQL